jgi:hypothetical protein
MTLGRIGTDGGGENEVLIATVVNGRPDHVFYPSSNFNGYSAPFPLSDHHTPATGQFMSRVFRRCQLEHQQKQARTSAGLLLSR